MKNLKNLLPQIRYLYFYVKKNKRASYLRYANANLVNSLWEIALNFMFSHKNGIELKKKQIQLLNRYKTGFKSLVISKTIAEKRKKLTNNVIDTLLAIFIPWVAKSGLEDVIEES